MEVIPTYLPNTLEQAQQSSGPLELDPDGPIRLGQPLADPDDVSLTRVRQFVSFCITIYLLCFFFSVGI